MALRAIDGSLRTGPSKLECYMAQSNAAYCPKILVINQQMLIIKGLKSKPFNKDLRDQNIIFWIKKLSY